MNQIDTRRQEIIDRESAKPGLRGKIDAMCCSCIFDPLGKAGNWRQQVEACTAPKCPLFSVRPTSSVGKDYPTELASNTGLAGASGL